MKEGYKTKGVKSGASASKCSSGTSNTKKGAYSTSNGPSGKTGNGFKNA